MFEKVYGDPSGDEMLQSLKNFVENYNTRCNETCAVLSSDPDLIVVIHSPLSKRVLGLEQAKEIMFVDSSGNMDRHGCHVFMFLTESVAGALPLEIMVSQSEKRF